MILVMCMTSRRATNVAALLLSIVVLSSCAESRFELAPESRLPKWFTMPKGLSRHDVEVSLAYYSMPWGSRAQLTLRDVKGNTIDDVRVPVQPSRSLNTVDPPSEPLPYPRFRVASGGGITEVFEHRRMEPVFYVTDDPHVRRKLGVPE